MKALIRRETEALAHSTVGWLVFALVPVAFALALLRALLFASGIDFVGITAVALFAFALIVPIYATKGYASDRRNGYDVLLSTLPYTPFQRAAAKLIASSLPVLAGTLLSCLIPLLLLFFAEINLTQAMLAMLLYALTGIAFTSLALLISRISRHALCNAAIALATVLVLLFMPQIVVKLSASSFAIVVYVLLVALLGAHISLMLHENTTSVIVSALLFAIVTFWGYRLNSASTSLILLEALKSLSPVRYFEALQIGVFHLTACLLALLGAGAGLALCTWCIVMQRHEIRRAK